ncbi:MAG: cyclase family protein [Candidatus Sericytochromatia bacterium]|nr:cyclase family protein [Candidatus Sericytochromatia bacterium]
MRFETPWLDVTRPLGAATFVFPGDPPVQLHPHATLDSHGCHVTGLSMGSHSGTHVDAPAHFVRGGATLSEVPLGRWNGPVWVLEIPASATIDEADLALAWPRAGAPERVLLNTRTTALAHPSSGLNLRAAVWLLERGVRLVGIDTPSIECDDTGLFPVHHALLGADCLIIEGLDLRGIAAGPYGMVCMPLKLDAPDGAPARVALQPL